MLLLLLACTASDGPSPPTDDTAGPDTGAPDTEDTCIFGDLLLGGDPVPGGTLTVSGSGEATWTVSAGTITPGPSYGAEWTLPLDVAVHEPETLTVTATGCGTASMDVEVDWPLAQRAVVLYNPSIEGSEVVADYYADSRGIDARCAAQAADATTLAAAETDTFLDTVQACIDAVGPQVHYVIPVYGVPYKVADRVHDLYYTDTLVTVSLDALLVYGAAAKAFTAPFDNQVYRRGDSMEGDYNPYKPFPKIRTNLDSPYYLVSRIDGADAAAAMDLVDRTVAAEALVAADALAGIVYVDGNRGDIPPETDAWGSYEWGEWNMWGTRRVFEDLSADIGAYEVVSDFNAEEFGTAPAPLTCPDALYYAGWYSYYHYNDAFTWAPGAIGGHLDSCSACDLRGGTWSGEALKRGITATFGAVNEPYVTGMPEYDQLFLYLTQGATYGEAAYESTIVSAWMMVFVGDPLYRPYPQ
ncbi:MAG: TIGR03790 family protein [Pseudomonadota bacterium]|nr:TIGR03790 family protein [Pseudomonadota bacterium]